MFRSLKLFLAIALSGVAFLLYYSACSAGEEQKTMTEEEFAKYMEWDRMNRDTADIFNEVRYSFPDMDAPYKLLANPFGRGEYDYDVWIIFGTWTQNQTRFYVSEDTARVAARRVAYVYYFLARDVERTDNPTGTIRVQAFKDRIVDGKHVRTLLTDYINDYSTNK